MACVPLTPVSFAASQTYLNGDGVNTFSTNNWRVVAQVPLFLDGGSNFNLLANANIMFGDVGIDNQIMLAVDPEILIRNPAQRSQDEMVFGTGVVLQDNFAAVAGVGYPLTGVLTGVSRGPHTIVLANHIDGPDDFSNKSRTQSYAISGLAVVQT